MDQIRKFGEQTSRILEFKPEGLEGYLLKSTQDLAKYWYKGCLCVYFTFPMSRILEQDRRYKIIFGML